LGPLRTRDDEAASREDVESVTERDLSDCFLIKPLRHEDWPEGQIDLVGCLF